MAHVMARDLFQGLIDTLTRMDSEMSDSFPEPVARRNQAAFNVRSEAEGFKKSNIQVNQDLAPLITDLTNNAIIYWTKAGETYQRLYDAVNAAFVRIMNSEPGKEIPLTEESVPKPPGELLTDDKKFPAFIGFAAAVNASVSGVTQLMGVDAKSLPDPTTYAGFIETALAVLEESRQALSDELAAFYGREQVHDATATEDGIWYGLAQWFIDQLITELKTYSADDDMAYMARWGNLPDFRLRHRYRTASFGLMLGYMVNDKTLVEAMLNVLRGLDVGYSFFAFTGSWVQDSVDDDAISQDFPAGKPVTGYGLSTNQIQRLYYLLYEQVLVASLRDILAGYGNKIDPENYGVIQAALRRTREEMPMPERWKPDQYVIAWNPNDLKNNDPDAPKGVKTVQTLVEAHPRFEELLDIGTHRQDGYILPDDRRTDVFVWFLPNFQRVIDYLMTIDLVGRLLKENFGEDVTPANLLAMLNLIEQWNRSEREAYLKKKKEAGKEDEDPTEKPAGMSDALWRYLQITKWINLELADAIKAAQSERDEEMNRANIYDRRVTHKIASDFLKAYVKADRDITVYALPNRALEVIDRFKHDMESNIPPSKDEEFIAQMKDRNSLHMAALILTLAPDLLEAFTHTFMSQEFTEERYDIITGYYGYISEALAFADTPIAEDRIGDVLDKGEKAAAIIAEREKLRTLKGKFHEVIVKIQEKFGMRTTTDLKGVMRVGGLDRVLPIEKAFTIDGVTYMIIEIFTPFVFHDSYGKGTAAETPPIVKTKEGNEGKVIPKEQAVPLLSWAYVQIVDGEEVVGEPRIITSMMLPHEVDEMERLSHAATMFLYVEGLNELADNMEYAMKFGIEAAAMLFPPGAAVLTAAEFAWFMAHDLPNIQEELLNAPREIVAKLQEFVSPENRLNMIDVLWRYLILGGELPFEETLRARAMAGKNESSKTPKKTGKASRFSKLITFIKRVAERLLQAFIALKSRVQNGLLSAQRVIMTYPRLQKLIGALPAIFEMGGFALQAGGSGLARLNEILDPQSPTEEGGKPPLTLTERIVQELEDGMSEAFNQLFDSLGGMLAPETLIPMEEVYAVILDRFVSSFGVRGKVVAKFLVFSGLDRELTTQIAIELNKKGYDPNLLWQSAVRGEIQNLLHDAQVGLAGGVNSLLSTYFGDAIQIKVPSEMPEVELDTSTPALEGWLDEDEDDNEPEFLYNPWDKRPPRVILTGGRSLSPAARARYEGGFGHDLSHVRVHDDQDADRLTEFYGAVALTSGSHIYLSDKLRGSGAYRDSILRHELAHVLQQTGARPLGFKQDPMPRAGAPNRGMVHDTRRELAASHMAREALGTRDNAMKIEEEGGLGLLPAKPKKFDTSTPLTQSIFDALQSGERLEEFAENLEAFGSVPTAAYSAFKQAQKEGVLAWMQIQTKLTSATASHAKPFDTIRPAIKKRFDKYDHQPKGALFYAPLRGLIFFNMKTKQDGTGELKRKDFISSLENYFLGAEGVILHIDDSPAGIADAYVKNINPAFLDFTGGLYDPLRDNIAAYRKKAGLDEWTTSKWERVRKILKSGDLDEGKIWHGAEYRFTDATLTEIDERLSAYGALTVGEWTDYIKTDDIGGATGGLRVATHGQLTGKTSASTRGVDPTNLPQGMMTATGGRQSHHVPQFLLVEYFENENPAKPVRSVTGGKKAPPGFKASGSKFSEFDGGGTWKIDFNRLDPNSGRGDGLPAVSLAAITHVEGQLHVNSASEWGTLTGKTNPLEYKGSWSQGVRLDLTFYKFLRDRTHTGHLTNDAKLIEHLYAHAGDNKTMEGIYLAIKDSYHWMYAGMMKALERALKNPKLEIDAYSGAVDSVHKNDPKYQPNGSYVGTIIAAVESRNKTIMAQWW